MTTILTTQENNLIESITRNYGMVSFELDAVHCLIHENRRLKDLADKSSEIKVKVDGQNVRKPNGPIKKQKEVRGLI